MATTVTRLIDRIAVISPQLGYIAESYDIYLQSLGRADETRFSYMAAVRQLLEFLKERHGALDFEAITRHDVRAFAVSLKSHRQPATVANRVRSLKQFFKWAVTDELIESDPMVGLKTPFVPEKQIPVISEHDLRALLATCRGDGNIWELRDYAILRIFMTTGARRSEVAGLLIEDVDLDEGLINIVGKGARPRVVAVDGETATALRLYHRARSIQPHAGLDQFWLSKGRVAFTAWGIERMLHRRCREAGIEKINLHRFRHTFAHMAMDRGMTDSNLMNIAGWKSRSMLDRYGAAKAGERAISAQRKLMRSFRL
jgi:site-specific recombinase XerD